LFEGHLLIALGVLFEYFNEEVSINNLVCLSDFEVLAEHHEFVDGHDGGFMHDLFESRILSCGIACLAVVLEDYFEIVLVLLGKMLEVEFIWVAGQVLVYVLLLFIWIRVLGVVYIQLGLDLLEVVLIFFSVLMVVCLLFLLFLPFFIGDFRLLMKRLWFWAFLMQLQLIFYLIGLFILYFFFSLIGRVLGLFFNMLCRFFIFIGIGQPP
jgi:hypothetical protein